MTTTSTMTTESLTDTTDDMMNFTTMSYHSTGSNSPNQPNTDTDMGETSTAGTGRPTTNADIPGETSTTVTDHTEQLQSTSTAASASPTTSGTSISTLNFEETQGTPSPISSCSVLTMKLETILNSTVSL